MPIVDVPVPQMGEGLQEVLVVEFFKKPGESIRRDELFYSMETDKATMEVESPHEGTLIEWLAKEGDTLAIGAPICRMEVAAETPATPDPLSLSRAAHEGEGGQHEAARGPRGEGGLRGVSPRTKAYAREKGITEDVLATIPASGPRLMPEDIDAFLAARASAEWTERPLSPQDKTFIYRLKRSAAMVVPAVAKRQVRWDGVRAHAEKMKAAMPASPPSSFNCVAYAIARAVKDHPKFRSQLVREDTIREFAHVNMGIAVAVPTGELTIALVRRADALSFEEFVAVSKEHIEQARGGQDQADENTHLLLTYMGPYEITDAVPVLVAPAVAVLFIGSPFLQEGKPVVTLALAFDHRLVHGVEAAEFLRTVARNIEALA